MNAKPNNRMLLAVLAAVAVTALWTSPGYADRRGRDDGDRGGRQASHDSDRGDRDRGDRDRDHGDRDRDHRGGRDNDRHDGGRGRVSFSTYRYVPVYRPVYVAPCTPVYTAPVVVYPAPVVYSAPVIVQPCRPVYYPRASSFSFSFGW